MNPSRGRTVIAALACIAAGVGVWRLLHVAAARRAHEPVRTLSTQSLRRLDPLDTQT